MQAHIIRNPRKSTRLGDVYEKSLSQKDMDSLKQFQHFHPIVIRIKFKNMICVLLKNECIIIKASRQNNRKKEIKIKSTTLQQFYTFFFDRIEHLNMKMMKIH
jgi:aminopeptidase C